MKKHLFAYLLLLLTTVSYVACSDSDKNKEEPEQPEYGWGVTMAGNNPAEITWPDQCENYWEYTLDVKKYPNVGIRLKGQFPNVDTRFFNITLYNDVTTQRITSIEDFHITPKDGAKNPFMEDGVTGEQFFEINIVPEGTSATVKDKMSNVMEFSPELERLCIFMRLYFFSTDHGTDFGGVDKPEIIFIDTKTGEELGKAIRAKSGYYEKFMAMANLIPELTSQDYMAFTIAPNVLYSNGPTGYVNSANNILPNEVLAFRFIPAQHPTKVSENSTADVRYWSICVGNRKTLTYATLPDTEVIKSDDGYVNFMIIEKTTTDFDKIVAKAKNMKINVIEWNNKTMDAGLMVFYRQMFIKKGFEWSVQNIPAYPPLNPSTGYPDPSVPPTQAQLAHNALGEHGPSGRKLPATKVLEETFSYSDMRIPTAPQK